MQSRRVRKYIGLGGRGTGLGEAHAGWAWQGIAGAGLYLSPPSFDTSTIGLKHGLAAATRDPL